MSRSPTALIFVFGLLAIASAGFAWYEHQQLQALAATSVMPEERDRLRRAAWDEAKKAKQLEAQLAAAHSARANGLGTALEGEKPPLDNHTLGDAAADYLARMEDPEIRRLMDIQRLANINRTVAPFLKAVRLTPEQLTQFQHLLLERQNAANDVLLAATQQGINPMADPAEFRQMVRNAQSEVDSQIKSTLGADSYAQFQSYQQTQGQRGTATQLQQDLSFSDTPLTDAQKEQMTQVIAQSNPTGGGSVNDKTLQLAQGVLSAPQLQALQNIQQLQQVNTQLQALMNQGKAGAKAGPAGPSKKAGG